nr:hypothetical protein [Pseudenhygromyxa sp. WMMC2535]
MDPAALLVHGHGQRRVRGGQRVELTDQLADLAGLADVALEQDHPADATFADAGREVWGDRATREADEEQLAGVPLGAHRARVRQAEGRVRCRDRAPPGRPQSWRNLHLKPLNELQARR